MLAIRLFGPPELTQAGRPLTLPRRKSRALVFYLAAQPHPVRREQLLALFWPDAERAAGQQTLRTTLHGLRKALGEALIADEDQLTLASEIDVDIRRFEAGLKLAGADPAALAASLELYRGEFLAGFSVPDAPAFDDWAAAERERLRRLAVRGLTALSGRHEAAERYPAALEALERALALDVFQEDIQRAALRLHYLAGDRAGAIRRYEQLRRLLDEELGVPPMAETRALYDSILTDTLARAPAPAARPAPAAGPAGPAAAEAGLVPPFTGRSLELEALRGLLPTHRLALLEGEAGIGKTRLAAEFLRTAAGLPLAGAAHELDQSAPYEPVREALRGLLARPEWTALQTPLRGGLPALWWDETARLLPELNLNQPAPASAPDEPRLWEGVLQFLAALGTAAGRPVLLFLDDLQWADASSLSLIGYLVRRAAVTNAPLFILGAARPYAARSPLARLQQTLTREGRLTRLSLTRLTDDEILDLAQHLSPPSAQPLADWLRRNSEGNPYILAEMVRALRAHGVLKPSGVLDLAALSTEPMLPQTVYSLIQARLARLSDPARRVLDAAVAAGREFEFDVVAHAAGLSESAALDALDELRAAYLVAAGAGPNQFLFDHTLTMEVAYREVGEPRHRLMHRRVAEAMESLRRDRPEAQASALAWHFAEGGAPERASPHAFRAGQQAARLAAWREAVAFFEQALAGADDRQRAAILTALGEARFYAGQPAEATEALRAALAEARTEPAQNDAIRRVLAQTLLNQGRFAEVIAEAQALLAEAAGAPDWIITAELLWGTALSLEGADLLAAAEHLRRAEALLLASPQPDPARLAQAKFELGSVAAQQGDLREAVRRYEETLAAAPRDDRTETWRILASNNLAYHLHLLGEPAAAEHIQRGLALARAAGSLTLLPFLLSTQGEIALAAGDLSHAEAAFTEGLALAEQFGNAERLAGLTANLGRLALARGETATAIHRLSTALARADALGTQHLAAQIRLWLAPLLPPAERRSTLAQARELAESGNRQRLLDEIQPLEAELIAAESRGQP